MKYYINIKSFTVRFDNDASPKDDKIMTSGAITEP